MSSIARPNAPTARLSSAHAARPDHARVPFALALDELEPGRAVATLTPVLAAVDARLRELGARLEVLDVRTHHAPSKVGDGAPRTTLEGEVDLPLPNSPALERAHLVARLVGYLQTLVAEGRKQRPPLAASIGAPVALVRDPEAHRAPLVAAWSMRLRSFVEAATAAGAPIAPTPLPSPQPLYQRPVSLERVELSLHDD